MKNIKNYFEIKEIEARDIKKGDLVLAYDGSMVYFVKGKGKTILHNHSFIEVIYNDKVTGKYLIHELLEENKGKRIVVRFKIRQNDKGV